MTTENYYSRLNTAIEDGSFDDLGGVTVRRGKKSQEDAREYLRRAVGTDSDEKVREVIRRGRPRIGSTGPSPIMQIRVTSEVRDQIAAYAAAHEMNSSEVVRLAIADFLATA